MSENPTVVNVAPPKQVVVHREGQRDVVVNLPTGPRGPAGQGFQPDAMGPFSERSSHDSQPDDFAFFATDQGNLYVREGATPGVWSAAIPFRGPQGAQGATGATGTQGPQGATGATGPRLPIGGALHQVPKKASSTNYDTAWGFVDFSELTFENGRPTYGPEQLALWSDRELEEDSRAETDPLSAWPLGITEMPLTAGANWNDWGTSGLVRTEHVVVDGEHRGYQELFLGAWLKRYWEPVGAFWTTWAEFVTWDSFGGHTHDRIEPLELDSRLPVAPQDDYPYGLSSMGSFNPGPGSDTFARDIAHVECTVLTNRVDVGDWDECHQLIYGQGFLAARNWDAGSDDWFEPTNIPLLSQDVIEALVYADAPSVSNLFVTSDLLFTVLGGYAENFNLPEDSRAEDDPITDYYPSFTVMPVSAEANWNGWETAGEVLTVRSPNGGWQVVNLGTLLFRIWFGTGWGTWQEYVNYDNFNGHTHDHIEPLGEDSRAETDPITDWPMGESTMEASAAADWHSNGESATVATRRTEAGGDQTAIWAGGVSATREWDGDSWNAWYYFKLHHHLLDPWFADHVHGSIFPKPTDQRNETAPVTDYDDAFSLMPVSAGASWNVTMQAGHVITERNGSTGKQTLVIPSTETSYVRYYTGGAWSYWEAEGGGSAVDASDTTKGITKLSVAAEDPDEPIAVGDNDERVNRELPEDSRSETDPLTAYPEGESVMKVSADADWDDSSQDGTVQTTRTGDSGFQFAVFGYSSVGFRFAAEGEWQGGWMYLGATPEHQHFVWPFTSPGAYVELNSINAFLEGAVLFPVASGDNWGPNAGEAGYVLAERTGSTGRQTFVVPATGTIYVRYYSGGAWSGWRAFSMEGHTHTASEITDFPDIPDDFYYHHDQSASAATWTIDHNLGRKPNIQVIDSSGNVLFPGIQHISDNQAIADLGTAYTGEAVAS